MRPMKLELEGFTSFRERTEIDFRGFDLFAITGQTGAGKTSLLDAMTYALYGRT
jgi:exonuclease SbcC